LNETSFDPNKVVPDISWLKNIDTDYFDALDESEIGR